MRTIYLIISLLFLGTKFGFSQQNLNHIISIDSTKDTAKNILKKITTKTGITFSYSNSIKVTDVIFISSGEFTVQSILERLFVHQEVEYIEFKQQIIIRKKSKPTKHTISGYVKEKGSGELLPGINIYIPSLKMGVSSNAYGFYSLTIPISSDSIYLVYSFLGYEAIHIKFPGSGDIKKDINLSSIIQLKEITVEASKDQAEKISEEAQLSKIDLPVWQIKTTPMLFGEKDVLKTIKLMPGVQKGNDITAGLYMRGGATDQNLLILDDAVLYNATHLFGLFSVFNPDALKSVEIIKGGFPARYGGRLSSVIDVTMKDGNKEKIHGEGGIGLVASRLTLEGPIIKNKSSFLFSGRRTYLDLLIKPLIKAEDFFTYLFYDLSTKLNYTLNEKNKLYLSAYIGQDRLRLSGDVKKRGEETVGMYWGNITGTLRWNHQFNGRLFSNTSFVASRYRFSTFSDSKHEDFYLNFYSGITTYSIKYDIDFIPDVKHAIKTGSFIAYHQFIPGATISKGIVTADLDYKNTTYTIPALESALYIEDTYQITSGLKSMIGLRVTSFYTSAKSYFFIEPRLALAYRWKKNWSGKISYTRMSQYVHMLTNTGIGFVTDSWIPATDIVKPGYSDQLTAGLAIDIPRINVELTMEMYHKKMHGIVMYQGSSSYLATASAYRQSYTRWQDYMIQGQGWSYGLEWFIQKKMGRFSGWIGYTLSWTISQFDQLNKGQPFYARYDRRHDISLVLFFQLSSKINLSSNWVYGTGNAITLPLASYTLPIYTNNGKLLTEPATYTYYGDERNGFRTAPYHRLDLSIQFHKKKKWGERTWEITIYNLYNRHNPYYYYISDGKLIKTSLIAFFPSLSYQFKF